MLGILDYDAGNLESVRLALRRVGGEPVFVRDAGEAARLSRIVFPGVGSAGACMANLRARGFDRFLAEAVRQKIPILAICVGMQLLFDFSEEDGGVPGLGILPGQVRRFQPRTDPATGRRDKVPHMGWNQVTVTTSHPVLGALREGDFYFAHSYHVDPAGGMASDLLHGRCHHAGVDFAAMVGRDSLFAVQFHPEKSGETGLGLLQRFLHWEGPSC